MARSLRIEYPGAVYHVINRGNYRDYIFNTDESKQVFEELLFDCCQAYNWRLYGYCIMGNHYHLALETVDCNLSVGMQRLQSTYANKVNKFRRQQGHLFQGRYKSIVVDSDGYLGPLLHYIHLNPLRSKMIEPSTMAKYRYSSLWYMGTSRGKRPEFLDLSRSLYYAGNLPDTPKGRKNYLAYLGWLSEDRKAQKDMEFKKMCRGWALGDKRFKEELVQENQDRFDRKHLLTNDCTEAREIYWEQVLKQMLKQLDKSSKDILTDKKGADWKVMIAHVMKRNMGVSNTWLSDNLNMGAIAGVSRNITKFETERRFKKRGYKELMSIIKT